MKWTVISGKKNIALKKKKKTSVIIAAKKAGSAKVQAKVGKKKYICKVTVKKKSSNTPTPTDVSATPSPEPVTPSSSLAPVNPTPSPNNTVAKNADDVAALQKIIQEQQALGATVSEDLDSGEYAWNENGRLVGIDWGEYEVGLNGSISFSDLTALTVLYCYSNVLSSLDVTTCTALTSLDCDSSVVVTGYSK